MTEAHQIISRAEAYELGLTHYFTGKPCKHGHVTLRFVKGNCVECQRIDNKSERFLNKCREWRANNKRRMKHNNLKKYGLTVDQYEELLRQQDFKCPICKDVLKGGKGSNGATVDHCHSTGKIRGILCNVCNRALGLLRDNEEALIRAAEYIRRAR